MVELLFAWYNSELWKGHRANENWGYVYACTLCKYRAKLIPRERLPANLKGFTPRLRNCIAAIRSISQGVGYGKDIQLSFTQVALFIEWNVEITVGKFNNILGYNFVV